MPAVDHSAVGDPLHQEELPGFILIRTDEIDAGDRLRPVDPVWAGASRHEIAGAMSALLDDDVSKMMLDAYAAESREQHNISMARGLALIAVTERFDMLDRLLRRIGAAVLVGEELHAARLGHLRAQERAIRAEIRKIEGTAQPIERGRP